MKQILNKFNLLRMTDGAEGSGAPVAEVDPLDTNVNDVDTSYPLLPAAYYSFKLEGCKKEQNKKGTGDNLVIPHKTVEATRDVKGQDVAPGLVITTYCSLTETAGGELDAKGKPKKAYTIDDIKKNVARVAKAAGVNATVRQIINSPSLLDGHVVKAKVKINPENDEFSASNGIQKYDTES